MYCQVSSSGGSLSKGHALWDFVSGNKNGAQLNYEIIISACIWGYPRSAECMRTRKKQCPNNQSNEPDAKAILLEPWTFKKAIAYRFSSFSCSGFALGHLRALGSGWGFRGALSLHHQPR